MGVRVGLGGALVWVRVTEFTRVLCLHMACQRQVSLKYVEGVCVVGSCALHQREVETVRLELARERTRRRGLEQEKERLESMLIQVTRAGCAVGGGGQKIKDMGDIASPRGLPSAGASKPRETWRGT